MSTIQNLKNFIRHGKQARAPNPPVAEPTTTVSTVTAQPEQRHHNPTVAARRDHYATSEPDLAHAAHPPVHPPVTEFSAANIDQRNVAAQAGGAAAKAAGDHQRLNGGAAELRTKDYDSSAIERIVAEEREAKGKLPRYPGLERWTLMEKMGDGAFSNVYRAKDNTGKMAEVAIKVVRKYDMTSSLRANILKEVQIMRQLDHPNIVRLIEFTESRQYYYIVLELCPGGELFHQIVRLTYFSEDLSRHVIVQVANALEYLHEEKGVVHRDIKPENLLFYPTPFIPSKTSKPRSSEDEDKEDEGHFVPGVGAGGIGQIKIADFGLSKVVWDTQTMTPCGTVGYTAPEIVKDERYSKSVDMWALGCVLYTLLCGFPPFYDESIQVLTEKVARGQYTFLSPWWDDISKSAQDLVSHLLTVNPDKRYGIREFLDHPWIRQTNEATHAAADAPPLATPAWQRNPLDETPMQPPTAQYLETPGVGARRMDFRSPGAVNLREVFDVGYAVRRQEEEGRRRKQFKGAAGMAGLNPLNEADDVEDSDSDGPAGASKPRDADVHQVAQGLRNTSLNPSATPARQQKGYGQHSAAVAAAAKQQVRRRQASPFELSLDNSTLLGRREKRGQDPSKLRQQLVL
ncbi:MAG: hypothetical protein M1826_007386 [Phylliscum demangeonii]|nr:MAG: hypothetical protein M1826_007386 [Phylliscum demangeonii]